MFRDRTDAGRRLAARLTGLRDARPIVLALPRGGVVVGYEVARALGAPLDVVVARKLGAPGQPEFGFGAVGPGGVRVLDTSSVAMLAITPEQIERIAADETAELARREARYRAGRRPPAVNARTVIVVDDGLATGGTARAAVRGVRRRGPARLVLAVPVAPPVTAAALAEEVDELICLHTPPDFRAVGQWYRDFRQTSDEEVVELLARARREDRPAQDTPPPDTAERRP